MKQKNKRAMIISIVVNIVILACIASVFGICFYTDPTAIVSSSGYHAIYRGNENNKNATLCINVYWGTEYVEDMLKTLKEENVKTTFFVGGMWASQNVELLKKIHEDGHEIANHGYYHKDHKKIDLNRNLQEISYTHKLIKELIGVEMDLFMPPSGSYGTQTLEAAESLGYKTIMWSKDTIDWRDKDVNLICKRATKNIENGDIVLMHPTAQSRDALKDIISAYKTAGFNIVPISENIG